jgi:hypothetical protein
VRGGAAALTRPALQELERDAAARGFAAIAEKARKKLAPTS